MIIHTVERGESLFSIARLFDVNMYDVANYNNIASPFVIVPGQNIIILNVGLVHTVQPGESLYFVSEMYSLSIKTIYRNNPSLIGRAYIEPGTRIILSYNEEKRGRISLSGYAYPNISENNLNYALKYLTNLIPFTLGITENGAVNSIDDGALRAAASENDVACLLSVSSLAPNGGFSSDLSDAVLNSPSARRRLITEISERMPYYSGVDMDFEYVYGKNAGAYASLLGELSEILNAEGKTVTVAAAPKTSRNQKGVLYEGHDYNLLGNSANYVFLMTYEWGYTYGPPMAVAPVNSVRSVLSYAVTEIDRNKILLGIPNYGYDWTLPFVQGESAARSISNLYAVNLASRYGASIRFDDVAMAPYFNYTDNVGAQHEVWFEDARSILAKLDLLTEFSLPGAGIWNIMYSFPSLYTLINALYDIED